MNIFIISETIYRVLDNTFFGTLFAGILIAYVGLILYKQQKKVDIETSRKEKLHDFAVNLLTHINVSLKDFIGQISVHDGTNPPAKMIFEKMESLSPGFVSNDVSNRFNGYIRNISEAFNQLSTPLALTPKNEERVKSLAETIPQLTFLLSATGALKLSNTKDLSEIKKLMNSHFDKIRIILESIINE